MRTVDLTQCSILELSVVLMSGISPSGIGVWYIYAAYAKGFPTMLLEFLQFIKETLVQDWILRQRNVKRYVFNEVR